MSDCRKYNSECLAGEMDGELSLHFFLYCMNQMDENITPEAVLFHELGHAVHMRYSREADRVSEHILRWMKEQCFPQIEERSKEEQSEILADILSVGFLFESPFEVFDPFAKIHREDKQAFSVLARTMMEEIKKQNSRRIHNGI